MPVIVFASSKGGPGKTTSAIILGSEFDERGVPVTFIDLERSNFSLTHWRNRAPLPSTMKFLEGVTESNVIEKIQEHDKDNCLIIVDLEGVVSRMTARAISQADLVILPMGTTIDALVGADTLKLIRKQEQMLRRKIKHSVIITRANAAFPSKEEMRIRAELKEHDVHILEPPLVKRASFSALFYHGGTLATMSGENGIEQAKENAAKFTDSVYERLQEVSEQ